jgi:hypothetical protein
VEATGNFHHEIPHAAAVKANTVLDTTQSLDPANRVFDSHPPSRVELVRRLLLIGQAAAARLLEGLLYFDPIHGEGEKAKILEQDTAFGQVVVGEVRDALI